MKKLLGTVAVLALAMPFAAHAADLPPAAAPAYKAPAYVPPSYNWSGFYIGADVGWWNADQSATTTAFPAPGFGSPAVLGGGIAGFGNLPTSHSLNGNGLLGGGFAGFNWQPSSWLVLGVEADIQALHRSVTDTEPVLETFTVPAGQAFNMAVSAENNWLASVRGRIGWTGGPFMLYGTGGAAFTKTTYTATATGVVNPAAGVFLPGVSTTASFSDDRVGWVAGAGAEWMVAPNWTIRAEWLHYEFAGDSANLPLILTSGVPGANCVPGACNWNIAASRLDIDTVRVGLSYKFGGPVVARY